MLTVHHLQLSQSERIVWLCEELGIDYRLQTYARDAVSRLAPADYKALHPAQTAPVITDGDVTLAESGAIMDYIMARHDGGRLAVPPDAPNFADYLFWLHYSNGSVVPAEMTGMIVTMLDPDSAHPFAGGLRERQTRAHALIEQRLAVVPYLAGQDFTAADIVMVFALTTMRAFTGGSLDARPHTRAYLARIGARPAYQRAMAAGDPDLVPMLA